MLMLRLVAILNTASGKGLESHIVNAAHTVNAKEIVKCKDKVCGLRIHTAGMSNNRLFY